MKKFFIIVALLLIPFTAMAGMMTMTNSDMEATTGQLGLGVDVTALDLDVSLSTGIIDIIPGTAIGMPEGFFQIGALTNVDITVVLGGNIDADIEITPMGIAIALDIADLDITVSALDLDIDCLAQTVGTADLPWPVGPTGLALAPMDLANLSITNLGIGVNSATLMVDVLPTVGLGIGTTQAP